MARDRHGRRPRPARATPRPSRPARTFAAVALLAVAGAVLGVGLASPEARDTAASAIGLRESAPLATAGTGEGFEAAVGPITAPSRSPEVPTPRISVSPGLDMDLHSLEDPASPWVVVNKSLPLEPASWEPPELERAGGAPMVPEASDALADMRAAAADAGVPLAVGSGYRAFGFQQSIYSDYVSRWGRDRADRFSARPGHSEHQTGWAVDVYGSVQCRLKECFADEPAGEWVVDNGHEYGFIVRYPPGTESITGYKHEPWHLRYVGVELATAMHEREIATMEEFFSLDPAPEYR